MRNRNLILPVALIMGLMVLTILPVTVSAQPYWGMRSFGFHPSWEGDNFRWNNWNTWGNWDPFWDRDSGYRGNSFGPFGFGYRSFVV